MGPLSYRDDTSKLATLYNTIVILMDNSETGSALVPRAFLVMHYTLIDTL